MHPMGELTPAMWFQIWAPLSLAFTLVPIGWSLLQRPADGSSREAPSRGDQVAGGARLSARLSPRCRAAP